MSKLIKGCWYPIVLSVIGFIIWNVAGLLIGFSLGLIGAMFLKLVKE